LKFLDFQTLAYKILTFFPRVLLRQLQLRCSSYSSYSGCRS